ncbi:MAG: metal-binding protein [Roseiflexaceae bacterium]|nr:metal-binding protein [Roseiflexaceae bacterium]
MPDARTHDIITMISGVALVLPVYNYVLTRTGEGQLAAVCTLLFVVGHCVSGMMFSPDLDLDSAIDDRWGVFFWIWRPYMWLVPHRSRWLSHGLLVPTLLRLLYFYAVVCLLLIVLSWCLARLGVILPNYHIQLTAYLRELPVNNPQETAVFMVGFITGGAAHTIADWLVTGGKRYLRAVGIRVGDRYKNHDRWQPQRRRVRAW